MDPHTSITPITDGEHWSDDTETSSEGTSPRHAGYAPLEQYQVLADEDEEEEEEKEEGEEGKDEQGGPTGGLTEAWREEADDSRFSGNQAGRQQGDVSSVSGNLRRDQYDLRICGAITFLLGHFSLRSPLKSAVLRVERWTFDLN